MIEQGNSVQEGGLTRAFKRAVGYETYLNTLQRCDRLQAPTLAKRLVADFTRLFSIIAPASARYFNYSGESKAFKKPFYSPTCMMVDITNVLVATDLAKMLIIGEYYLGILNPSNPLLVSASIIAADIVASKVGINTVTHLALNVLETKSSKF